MPLFFCRHLIEDETKRRDVQPSPVLRVLSPSPVQEEGVGPTPWLFQTKRRRASRKTATADCSHRVLAISAGAGIPRCLLVDSGWLLGPFRAPSPSVPSPQLYAGRRRDVVRRDVGEGCGLGGGGFCHSGRGGAHRARGRATLETGSPPSAEPLERCRSLITLAPLGSG